jgi:hypothetical protein
VNLAKATNTDSLAEVDVTSDSGSADVEPSKSISRLEIKGQLTSLGSEVATRLNEKFLQYQPKLFAEK